MVPGAQPHRGLTLDGAWRTVARAWERIPLREPWRVLVPLLVVHWLALVAFTTKVHHNGWLFYQGGDQIWYWTTGWLLGHGGVADAFVAPGWSLLLMPFVFLGGPGYLGGLPLAMLLQILVLAPIALWCLYELGARVGGRWIGYAAAALWTIGPYLAVPLFVQRYHDRYVDQFLPVPLGLTAMADYVGTVCILASALFTVRAVGNRDPGAGLVAGLIMAYAAIVKPSNLIFVAAPLITLAAARRWRALVTAGVAVGPALVTLAIWKYKGYGYVPAFAGGEQHVIALGKGTLTAPYHKYVHISWDNIHENLDQLREFFWSVRVLQWIPFAGAIAAARRSVPLALLLSVWFWAFFLLKGSADEATVESGSFFRLLLPAVPALILLAVSVPLLVPKYGGELVRRTALPAARAVSRRWLVAAVIGLGLAPIVAAAAASPETGPDRALQHLEIAVPVSGGLDLTAATRGRTVVLDWKRPVTRGSDVYYRVFRSPASTDYICFSRDPGADQCTLVSVEVDTTRRTSARDRPGSGTWTYRVGVGANWLDDPGLGDIFLLSKPVTVRVP